MQAVQPIKPGAVKTAPRERNNMKVKISEANQEYIELKNKLIPIAEATTNQKTKEKGNWNRIFFEEMDSLAKLIPLAQSLAKQEIKSKLRLLSLDKLDFLLKERGFI